MTTPRTPTAQLVNDLLTGGYDAAAQQVLTAMASDLQSGVIDQRLNELEVEAGRLEAIGERLSPDNPVYLQLLRDMDAMLQQNEARITGAAPALTEAGVNASNTIAQQLTIAGMPEDVSALVNRAWNRPDPQAVAALVDFTQDNEFSQMLSTYHSSVIDALRNRATFGFVNGWGARRSANAIRTVAVGMPRSQAETLMRTLHLVSYRRGTAATHAANARILQPVALRIAVLDPRTCFPKGTMISTSTGVKPIETIVKTDMVLTHTGEYQSVTETMSRAYSGKVISITANNHRASMTEDHPVLVRREGNYYWMSARDCWVGDSVLISRNNHEKRFNHGFIDSSIKWFGRGANYIVSILYQALYFAMVCVASLFMPVHPIYLQSQISIGQEKINRITVYTCFLDKILLQGFKANAYIFFGFCLACISTIAYWATKFLMGERGYDPVLFSTIQASIDYRWTAAFLGAILSIISIGTSIKLLTTSFAFFVYNILSFTLQATNNISISIRGGNSKFFVTQGANFGDGTTLMPTLDTAKSRIPFRNFRFAQFKSLFAYYTGKFNTLALSDTHTSTTTIFPTSFTKDIGLNTEGVPTHLANSFDHVEISHISSVYVDTIVHNIEVQDDHTYVANDILVHNCLTCIALHGDEIPLGEPVADHYQGRCTAIAQVRGFNRNIVAGADWFSSLPSDRQAQQRAFLNTPAMFDAYQDGAVQLRDFVTQRTDPLFGEMVFQNSLRGVLGDDARQYYRR